MKSLLYQIEQAQNTGKKLLAVLIDPDKPSADQLKATLNAINERVVDMILIGGSQVENNRTDQILEQIRPHSNLPLVLFPGSSNQITEKADSILFLSLISGRNPDYLIEEHIEAVPLIESTRLEVIPTAYILIENGGSTSVERVSGTKPLKRDNVDLISRTAKAGEYLGMKLIYLEAGSGAHSPVSEDIISEVRKRVSVPLIVGGGVKTRDQIEKIYVAGADMVVIGTAIERDPSFLSELK
ncbi:MAG: geranylgeranylglyceryl/heptaprenylglyceryl phosphate synthase [Bacteroidia bacterium]|nr:geranylgeranylglyceryl/heptaprenylglyceryl phosphate synthase [Bacteroidia bacterium]